MLIPHMCRDAEKHKDAHIEPGGSDNMNRSPDICVEFVFPINKTVDPTVLQIRRLSHIPAEFFNLL